MKNILAAGIGVDTATSAAQQGFGTTVSGDISAVIGQIITVVLSILGVVFLVLIIYAGVLWMTGGGNEKQIEKAKAILVNSVIGLFITLAAYSITYFVIQRIGGAAIGA